MKMMRTLYRRIIYTAGQNNQLMRTGQLPSLLAFFEAISRDCNEVSMFTIDCKEPEAFISSTALNKPPFLPFLLLRPHVTTGHS